MHTMCMKVLQLMARCAMSSVSALHVLNATRNMACLHTGAEACGSVQASGRSAILPALSSSSPAMSLWDMLEI